METVYCRRLDNQLRLNTVCAVLEREKDSDMARAAPTEKCQRDRAAQAVIPGIEGESGRGRAWKALDACGKRFYVSWRGVDLGDSSESPVAGRNPDLQHLVVMPDVLNCEAWRVHA